jgi:hypothetical protein
MSWETLPCETLLHFFRRVGPGLPSVHSQRGILARISSSCITRSKPGHVTSTTDHQHRATQSRRFEIALIFSMNDEVMHTAYQLNPHDLLILRTTPVR